MPTPTWLNNAATGDEKAWLQEISKQLGNEAASAKVAKPEHEEGLKEEPCLAVGNQGVVINNKKFMESVERTRESAQKLDPINAVAGIVVA